LPLGGEKLRELSHCGLEGTGAHQGLKIGVGEARSKDCRTWLRGGRGNKKYNRAGGGERN